MKPKTNPCVLRRFPAFLLVLLCSSHSPALEIMHIGQIDSANGTGSVAYDASSNSILSSNDELNIQIHDFGNGANLSLSAEVDLSQSVEGARFVSGVAADPNGRGFGVATVIPNESESVPGKLVFFRTLDGHILQTVDVGFGPDNVTFHPDANKILVANEGEPGADSDPIGSISVVDVSQIVTADDLATLPQTSVSSWDFSSANLAAGVTLNGIRVDPVNAAQPHVDLEPESIVGEGNHAYVTLQENNAIAVFDLAANKWAAIHDLGTIEQRIDASDRDGPNGDSAALIDDLVHGLPQPDGIIAYRSNDVTYLATANEGDARVDFDFGDHGTEGNPFIDADALASLSSRYTVDPMSPADVTENAILGRLGISPIDGDTDGDGDIDRPTMFGTRSFSIYDAATGQRVFDSGSGIEEVTLADTPTLFNSGGTEGSFDSRSDNKGAEPEAIALGQIGESTLAFVGLERTGSVLMYDITDPADVTLLDVANTHLDTGSVSPEGLTFVSSADSFDAANYLIVGYDDSASLEVFRVVPEPSSSVLILGLGGLVAALQRRRRRQLASETIVS